LLPLLRFSYDLYGKRNDRFPPIEILEQILRRYCGLGENRAIASRQKEVGSSLSPEEVKEVPPLILPTFLAFILGV